MSEETKIAAEIASQGPQQDSITEADIVAGLRAGREAMESGDLPSIPRPSDDENAAAGVPPKAAPPPDVPDPPPAKPDPAAPKISDEVLRLSKMQRQMDEQHRKRVAEVEKKEAELAEFRKSVDDMERRLQQALEDPFEFYKSAGYDPIQAAKLIAAQGGLLKDQQAPADIRLHMQQMRQKTETKTEIEKLREEISAMKKEREERDQRAELERYVSERKAEYGSWLTEVPDHLQHVKRAAAARPEWVSDKMTQVLAIWAERNPGSHESIPGPEQLAEWLNSHLEEEYGFLASTPGQPAAKTPEPPAATPQSTGNAEPLPTDDLQARSSQSEWPDDDDAQVAHIAAMLRAKSGT